jgi:hypothetical protein
MEPTSNGQTGNETGPKFQVMLVAAESYDTKTAKEKLNQAMNLLAIEFGRFEQARNQIIMGLENARHYQRLNAGEFRESEARIRGFNCAGVTIIIGTGAKDGFHIYDTSNPESSLTVKQSGGNNTLLLSDGTYVTAPKKFSTDYDFNHEGDINLTDIRNLIVRGIGPDGIFVETKGVDPVAWINYDLAAAFTAARRKLKGDIETKNLELRRSLLGTILLKLGLRNLEPIPEGMPESHTPNHILLDYRVATESLEKMYGLLNLATRAINDLERRNI